MKFLDVEQNVNKRVKPVEGEDFDRLMQYPHEGINRVYNPCAWPIEVGVDGKIFRIKGFQIGEFETYDIYHINHLLQTGKYQGLVTLAYEPKAREAYPNFADYINKKSADGLKAALKHWEQVKEYQKIAVHSMAAHKDPNLPQAEETMKAIEFRIAKINEWLKEAGQEIDTADYQEVDTKRPSYKAKKVKNDSNTVKK